MHYLAPAVRTIKLITVVKSSLSG
uniref:Uncharacterized protein n=1 Tax=Anguilla anguilla TaxID=7936 RepID=A0A0E9TL52_ANGAN